MPDIDLIKTSFAAGELAEGLTGRVDLAKYSVGASTMRNFFVDARGGAMTRTGTAHVGMCRVVTDDPKPRSLPFIFSSDQAYILELNGSKMRVIQDGAYITTAVTNPITAVTRGVHHRHHQQRARPVGRRLRGDQRRRRLPAHERDQRPERPHLLRGRGDEPTPSPSMTTGRPAAPDYVAVVSTSWTAWTSGGTVRKIYEISTPWAGADLFTLTYAQQADILTVCSVNYPVYEIRRYGSVNWQIAQVVVRQHGTAGRQASYRPSLPSTTRRCSSTSTPTASRQLTRKRRESTPSAVIRASTLG